MNRTQKHRKLLSPKLGAPSVLSFEEARLAFLLAQIPVQQTCKLVGCNNAIIAVS